MATSTEQDPSTDLIEEPPKVIAIKLPFDLQQRLLAFPFLHALREFYPKSEIHFITPRKHIEVLNLLPFHAFYHEFDENEIKTIFDVHRFCVHAKIHKNVDLFISLTNSFVDACLGFGLRAKERLGFSDGWKTLVLNQKTNRPVGHHMCEDYFALYKVHRGAEFDTRMKIMSRELAPIISDWDAVPYVAINLNPIRGGKINEDWYDLVSKVENQKFIFFSEDQDTAQLYMEKFLERLPKKNIYVNFVYTSWIDLAKMLAYARGVITYNGPVASVSAYVGSKTIALYDWEDPQRYAPLYFLADTMFLTLEGRTHFNMETMAKRAFEFFRL